jgi:hypothetical protein
MNDAASLVPLSVMVSENALRPLAPVHQTAAKTANGDLIISWTRCSRSGVDWLDGVEAPLAEAEEAYHVNLLISDPSVVSADVSAPSWIYSAAAFAANGDVAVTVLLVQVAQVSAVVGPGRMTAASFPIGGLTINSAAITKDEI